MIRPEVLVDVDGVLADFCGGLCNELRGRGHNLTPEDIRHWNLIAALGEDVYRDALVYMEEPGFCHSLSWHDGAKEALQQACVSFDVHIVTAPFLGSATWVAERISWLRGVVEAERVHFVTGKYKYLLRGNYLIEDHPGNAANWLDANPQGTAYLVSRPWNQPGAREYWPHSRMIRVDSVQAAFADIEQRGV